MTKQLDLNLLAVFDAIMSERNLRLAAERLGRSQPAVSQSVARLRDLLGDRLFEKTPKGVRPTPRAEALWLDVRDHLDVIRQALTHSAFSPAAVAAEVTVGLADDIHEMVFASLVSHLRRLAPSLILRVAEVDHQSVWQNTKDGLLDLAVTVAPAAPRGLGAKTLFEQRFVLLHRADMVAPATLLAYLNATHVAVAFRAGEPGYTDQRLADMGQARRVIAWTPRFSSIPALVGRTGALATMPEPIARFHAAAFGLSVTPLPFALDPVPVRLCWHERRRTDPLNAWLRGEIETAVMQAIHGH